MMGEWKKRGAGGAGAAVSVHPEAGEPTGRNPWDRRLGVWWIAEDQPDAPAISASPTGARTFAELAASAHQLVHALRSRGLRVGDAVAVMAPNGVELVELSLACQEAGWFFVPLNTYLTAGELAGIVETANAAALFVHERFRESLVGPAWESIRGRRRLFSFGEVAGAETAETLRRGHPSTMPPDRVTGSIFTFTSGTTGKPKGIRRAAPAGDPSTAANAGALLGRAFDFRPFEGPHLVSTGMHHGGSHTFYMGALNVGHSLVIMERFDPEETLRLIERHRITTAYMVPTQFHRLLRLSPQVRSRHDLSSLRVVVHSAAPCPLEIKKRMLDWWGPVIWETYGGMEGAATIAKPHRWLEKPGTVGRAVRGVTLAILDDAGKSLPPKEPGLVYMSVDGPSFEYTGDRAGADEAFRGKQFTLGDVGYLDEDGYLFIRDRAKDMIITGGVNVYPQEIEAVLAAHPAVLDVAVIGTPNDEWGEEVKAVIQPAAGAVSGADLERELLAWCRERLASYKCPRSVDFRDELPRTDAGKLLKRRLRDEYWQDAGRAV
jgi:long-chain acyl-CoA synthetase